MTTRFQVNSGTRGAIQGAHLLITSDHLRIESVTDADGFASIDIPFEKPFSLTVNAINSVPKVLSKEEVREPEEWGEEVQEILLEDLPSAHRHLGWWHATMGIRDAEVLSGKDITIAVIDTGVSKHPHLAHVKDCGSLIQGQLMPDLEGRDTHNHGTAVVGLIGGTSEESDIFRGMAPQAKILSLKAFDEQLNRTLKAGTEAEIGEAIFWCIEQNVDLINCSFELEVNVEWLSKAIEKAYNNGILCICAAGNNKYVAFPARHPKAVAVSAIGIGKQVEGIPFFQASAPRPYHRSPDWKDDFFVATFSGRGKEISCCAPGVAVIAAAIPRYGLAAPYQMIHGTSFATPLVCGLLASALGTDENYKKLPRTSARANYARAKLKELCVPMNWLPDYEGEGLVTLHNKTAVK
jgi:hypothetical protein